jgi:DNA-binding response OmpR family regulator
MPRRPLLLVVEDDAVLRELFRVALSLSNFTVHACEDGLDALHYLDQERPDVIVLDLDLPRVSGTVLYDEMRARRRADRVPIVVVTGLAKIPDLPAATVLRKPVTPDELIKVLELVLIRRDRSWLYTRGNRSVLISRIGEPGPNARLHVFGPGQSLAAYDCNDWAQCLARQQAIERSLIAEGYQLLTSERRRGPERRSSERDVPDRRRDISALSDS